MNTVICFAGPNDFGALRGLDVHIGEAALRAAIEQKRVLTAKEDERLLGWLRYNLFWDNTPFMNLLFVLEPYRGMHIGKQLVLRWENEMKLQKHALLMTSTQADETAQHFYRKLGYRDAGALLPPGQALEIFFIKEI